MTDNKLAKLRLEMVEATRLSFDACRREHPDETIYAYALVVCSPGGEALQPWCYTEEALAKREAKWPPKSVEAAGLNRYCPDEWVGAIVSGPIKTSRGRDWHNIQDDLAALYEERGDEDRHVVLEMLIDTLESLDREGYFGTGAAREAVTLMIFISDSGPEEWWDSVCRLNPPAVRKRFEDAAG
jgi:hypothetical protein